MDDDRIRATQGLWSDMLNPLDSDLMLPGIDKLSGQTREFLYKVGLPNPNVLFQRWKSLSLALIPYSLSASLVSDSVIWKQVPVFNVANSFEFYFLGKEYTIVGIRGSAKIGINLHTDVVMLLTDDEYYLNENINRYIYAIGLYLGCRFQQLQDEISDNFLIKYKSTNALVNPTISLRERINTRYTKLLEELSSDDPSILAINNAWQITHVKSLKQGL